MHSLATLQSEVAQALFAGTLAELSADFSANGGSAAPRLNIYRNNTFASLTEALKANFPMTVRMIDERFFRFAAASFIAEHPPREPRLAVYGAKFPKFLAWSPASRDYPLIGELAAFEWSIVKASTAAEHEAAPVALLQRIKGAAGLPRLKLQPNLQFVLSHWPILEIWCAHHTDTAATMPTFARRPTRAAIYRKAGRVKFLEVGTARFTFWRRLFAGDTLERAAARALARDPLLNLIEELVVLFRCGLVTGIAFDAVQS